MTLIPRYLTQPILQDLPEKMVFIGGPRQVGKTTLARDAIASGISHAYFNWDKPSLRVAALRGEWPGEAKLIVLDELHKYRKWKTWLKGEWDTRRPGLEFLITGSAHLNLYRRGGDSLQGRYHYYTLHPFSLAEIMNLDFTVPVGEELRFFNGKAAGDFTTLFHCGGFPEPYLRQEERFLRRWRQERFERFFQEDIRELTLLHDLTTLAVLADLLPERASSILSVNALAEDLQVNFRTVANWLNIFEQFYYCFTLGSYQTKKVASVKKAKKIYLWDWTQIADEDKRLENMVAAHLLKLTDYLHEREGYDIRLHYLRNQQGKEVDFLVTVNSKPWFAVEVKASDTGISKELTAFREKLDIPFAYQVVKNTSRDFIKQKVRVIPAATFLTGLV